MGQGQGGPKTPKAPTGAAFAVEMTKPTKNKVSKPSQEKRLNAEELSGIILLCKSNNVLRMKTPDGFEIELAAPPTANPSGGERPETPKPDDGARVASVDSPLLMTVGDRQALEDMEQSQLLIDDPLGFEQAQIDGHLRGSSAEEADDRRAESDL